MKGAGTNQLVGHIASVIHLRRKFDLVIVRVMNLGKLGVQAIEGWYSQLSFSAPLNILSESYFLVVDLPCIKIIMT